MRLLIVGSLEGQLSTATKIAMARGARVTHADGLDQALKHLRSGNGADLVFIDVDCDIARLVLDLKAERIHVPLVACGVRNDAEAAVRAIRAGAKEYIPLPPDPELIAAILAAVAEDDVSLIWRDPAMARVVKLADQIAQVGSFRAHHRRVRHRQGSDRASRPHAIRCAPTSPSSRSTAPRSRRTCSSRNSSATKRAPSPAPSHAASASSRRRTAAPSFSTKSARWICAFRRSCSAPSRSG